jgi:hypothetical protein
MCVVGGGIPAGRFHSVGRSFTRRVDAFDPNALCIDWLTDWLTDLPAWLRTHLVRRLLLDACLLLSASALSACI